MKLKPCPFCGFEPDTDDDDCVYPVCRAKTVWAVHCYETGGGCTASILGSSEAEAIEAWQRRQESSQDTVKP